MNKVFETILHMRMIDFRKNYGLFTNCQFGFRKKHSTSFAITYLHETILKERDANKFVSGMFLEFAKTFYWVYHQILLHKLERFGDGGITRNLFCSYFLNRLQYTVNTEKQFVSENLQLQLQCRKVACAAHFYSIYT